MDTKKVDLLSEGDCVCVCVCVYAEFAEVGNWFLS